MFASARIRILASYLVLLLFSTVVGTLALREVLLARTGERVDDALVQETREFRQLAHIGRDPRSGEPFGNDLRMIFDVFLSRNVPGEREALFTYVGGEGYRDSSAPTLRSTRIPGIDALGSTTTTRRGELELDDGTRFRYVAVPVRDTRGRPRGVFAVVLDLSGELDEVNDALQIAVGVSIGVLILASMLAWVVTGRVLAPLRDLRDTARSITESDLTRRIAVEGDDELADLARTFNEMLDRLETAFASQKAFISDAGHELRSPITIVRGHLDVMGDDPEERRETLQLVGDELDRMGRLVNDLLLLAKASRPDFLQPETIDLDDLTRELFNKASALAQRDWRLGAVGAGRFVADRQRLTQAIMNLSQNAVAHTHDGDAIELGSGLTGGRVRLWVKDTGPGVAEQERCASSSASCVSKAPPRMMAQASGLPSRVPSPRHTAGESRSTAPWARAPASPSSSRASHRRRCAHDEPHPDHRGRAAARLIPGKGPALERLRHHRRRGRSEGQPDGARRRVRPARSRSRAAGQGRHGGPARAARLGSAHAGDHPYGSRRRERLGGRARGRRRRLRDKALRFEELLARVRLRDERTVERTVLRAGAIVLDLRTRRASTRPHGRPDGARVTMLEVLIRHAGQVLSREQLLSHVWGYDYDPGSNVVDVYVGYLRKTLGSDSVETVRGMGYRLTT